MLTLLALVLLAAPPNGGTDARAPAPAGSAEGDFVEIDGEIYEVHGGKLYTLDDPALDDPRLTVTVTGSNVKSALQKKVVHTDVITAADIDESGAHTLGDILEKEAGIQVNPSFGLGQSVQMDGLDGRQVLVLIDGKPVKGRVDSHVDVSRLPVSGSSIERIEIVRGPASALYGSEALGGVINIVTKRPSAAAGGEVDAGATLVPGGVWTNLALHGRGGAGPVAARVDVSAQSLPGLDRGGYLAESDIPRDAKDRTGAARDPRFADVVADRVVLRPDGRLDLPDRRQLALHVDALTSLTGVPGDAVFRAGADGALSHSLTRSVPAAEVAPGLPPSSPAAFSERARDDEWSVFSGVDFDAGPAEVSVDVRVDRFEHVFDKLPKGDLLFPPGFCSDGGLATDPACPAAPVPNTDAVEDEARLEAKATAPLWRDVLDGAAGVVLTREQDSRKNAAGEETLPGDRERDVASLYAELSYTPLAWVTLVPGVRFDAFTPGASDGNLAISPKLAAKADVLDTGLAVRASYGHGFRLPSYEERLLHFDHSELGYIVDGNPDLAPESENAFRGGLAWESPFAAAPVTASAEIYLNLVDGLIDFADTGGADGDIPIFTYVNKAHAYTSGVDLRLSAGPFFGVSVDGGYQYLINAVDSSACPASDPYFCSAKDGARSLALRPIHSGNATVRWRLAATGTVLFARVDGLSERPFDAVEVAPGYAVLGAGVRQPIIDTAELVFTADNLFDAYDPRLGPKPGRSASILLRFWK